jgi:hypothetical protein
LVCATTDELLFCGVVAQEHGIARHLTLDAVPKRILYSQFLHKHVVAFSKEGRPRKPDVQDLNREFSRDEDKDASQNSDRKVQRVGLQLISADLTLPINDRIEGTVFSTTVTDNDSDIIRDFINWAPTDGENHYEWLVLAVEQVVINPLGMGGHGRVVCINAKSLGKGKPDSHPKIAWKDTKPVTAICAYKMSSLLIACGKELILRNLNFRAQRWETWSRHPLPSHANAISCQGSLICVATHDHSLFVLVERNNQLQQHNCDTQMRYAKDIAVLNGSTAVFAAADASGTNVIGIGGLNTSNGVATPLFHAKIPGHIHKFRAEDSEGLQGGERLQFYGATIDGTMFHFSLLKEREWKLLHFIEELGFLHQHRIKAVPTEMVDQDGNRFWWEPPKFFPKDMHVQGDRLLLMVENGPYNLRKIMKGSGKLAELGTLVKEVLDETEHPVEVAIAWMRKLLTYPPRS